MSDLIISEVDDTTTSGAVTATVVDVTIPDGFFGILSVDATGEEDGSPADAYGFQNIYLVSGEGGAATLRDSSNTPVERDPNAVGVAVTVDTSGATVRVRATGVAAQDWVWAAHIGGLLHER